MVHVETKTRCKEKTSQEEGGKKVMECSECGRDFEEILPYEIHNLRHSIDKLNENFERLKLK